MDILYHFQTSPATEMTDERQNHYVNLSHQHSWLGSFARSITGFEQQWNYCSKFTHPSFLAFGGKKQESNFLWWKCQGNSNTGHQLHEFLGLGTLHFARPKPSSTTSAYLVAQNDLNLVKHARNRSFAPRSTAAISQQLCEGFWCS